MKEYFLQLFDYDQYANHLITEEIVKANGPEKSVQLMAHLLAAQQIWLSRCKREPATGSVLWPDWQSNIFKDLINSNHQNWINYLSGLNDDDFTKVISYQNSKGETFENKLVDVFGHLINHGTHHRAQAGQHLKFTGHDHLPNTDYIFYIRSRK